MNILDWRALSPGVDHFLHTISKAAFAAPTRSLAVALAPRIAVNGLSLGAVRPPPEEDATPDILRNVLTQWWEEVREVEEALILLPTGPACITGKILHVDGGRHVV